MASPTHPRLPAVRVPRKLKSALVASARRHKRTLTKEIQLGLEAYVVMFTTHQQ